VLKVEIYIRKIGVGQEWIFLTMINRRYQTIKRIWFLWIIEKVRVKKPMKRLRISSQTEKAIKEGFNNLKPYFGVLNN
jgi:DNA topoisomerase IA